ncbi:MAG TPA: mobile mystery protein A [Spirochaetota bacterium]|nr:mobile mystery protein A [Spirochaetota bacterium]
MKNQNLILEQVDRQLKPFSGLKEATPVSGWLETIRIALKITLKQLGQRLMISAPSVKEMEKREKKGNITLSSLKKYAQAMDMHFVYGFIPKDGSLGKMIENKALEKARQIVTRSAQTMELEEQAVSKEQLKKTVTEKQEEIIREMPKYLWD